MRISPSSIHLSVASLLLLPIFHQATADEAETTLTATAGLGTSITLECGTDLSFGVTRMDFANHNGEAWIDIGSDGGVTVGNNSDGISATGAVSRGECTISGALEGEPRITVAPVDGSDYIFTPQEGAEGLTKAGTSNSGIRLTEVTYTDDVAIDADGTATFNVWGRLVLPTNMDATHVGGWSTEVSVTVNDSP